MFITEEQWEKIYKNGDRETLDQILEGLFNKAIEETLKMMPDIIVGLIVKTKGVSAAYKQFIENNPEFEGKEKELALIIEAIELENGALSLEEILKKVPEKVKDMNLSIPKEQPHTIEEAEVTANGYL